MTMSPAERATMGEHVAYCQSLLQKGKVLLFGPVADREAVWGCAVLTWRTMPRPERSSMPIRR